MTLILSTFQITTSEAIPVHKLIKEPSMEGPLGYRALYIILYSLALPPKVSCPQLNVATQHYLTGDHNFPHVLTLSRF